MPEDQLSMKSRSAVSTIRQPIDGRFLAYSCVTEVIVEIHPGGPSDLSLPFPRCSLGASVSYSRTPFYGHSHSSGNQVFIPGMLSMDASEPS
jgi:hypothetical protein